MREGTISREMAADRPYGEFYDLYSVSPEYFAYTLVYTARGERFAQANFEFVGFIIHCH
jgi:hypothetical protein